MSMLFSSDKELPEKDRHKKTILNTVNPHYSWTPYFQIYLSLKCICNPKINICSIFTVICGQRSEKSEPPTTCIPNRGQTRRSCVSLFQFSHGKQVSSGGGVHLVLCFLHLCIFLLVTLLTTSKPT